MAHRINRKDRVLLESLNDKYGLDMLAKAIIATNNDMNGIPNAERDEEDDVLTEFITYLEKIEGYMLRLREMHWSAERNSKHELCDTLIDELASYEDELAEDFMGILGYRIKVGSLVPIIPKEVELKAVISRIIMDSVAIKSKLAHKDGQWEGIRTQIDDCIHVMQKSKYLSDMV